MDPTRAQQGDRAAQTQEARAHDRACGGIVVHERRRLTRATSLSHPVLSAHPSASRSRFVRHIGPHRVCDVRAVRMHEGECAEAACGVGLCRGEFSHGRGVNWTNWNSRVSLIAPPVLGAESDSENRLRTRRSLFADCFERSRPLVLSRGEWSRLIGIASAIRMIAAVAIRLRKLQSAQRPVTKRESVQLQWVD